jgi:hypothetical protein
LNYLPYSEPCLCCNFSYISIKETTENLYKYLLVLSKLTKIKYGSFFVTWRYLIMYKRNMKKYPKCYLFSVIFPTVFSGGDHYYLLAPSEMAWLVGFKVAIFPHGIVRLLFVVGFFRTPYFQNPCTTYIYCVWINSKGELLLHKYGLDGIIN